MPGRAITPVTATQAAAWVVRGTGRDHMNSSVPAAFRLATSCGPSTRPTVMSVTTATPVLR